MRGFKEAQHYRKVSDKKVHCVLCPHSCFIENGEVGKCNVRQNMAWKLKTLTYAKTNLISHSKIENNYLYHFLPNSESLNLATPGHNFLSKTVDIENIPILEQTPSQILKQVKKSDSKIITYCGEPTIFYEYMNDIIERADVKNVISTSGFIEQEPIKEISGKVDAFIFDISSMTEEVHEKIIGGKLEPILKAIKIAYDEGKWVEIKMTVVPEMHHSFYDIRKLVAWILNKLGPDVPLHFLSNSEDRENQDMVFHARKIALDAGLNYVYTDNVNYLDGRTTFCPNCKGALVVRDIEHIENFLKDGKCKCGKQIPGVWQ